MSEVVYRFTAETIGKVCRAVFDRYGSVSGQWEMAVREAKRTTSQNRKLWPMLADVANHCQLCINGQMAKASPEDWKEVFTASLKREQRMAQGIDGGLVILGARTSRMRKAEFSELIELIYAYGAQHGVEWSEPALAEYQKWLGEGC